MTTTSRPRLVFAAFLAAAVTVGCSATVSDTTAPAPSATTPANPTSDAARCRQLQASCPFVRGSPRSLAHRPLPSMTTATWRGSADAVTTGGRAPEG